MNTEKIDSTIEIINQLLDWFKAWKPEQYEQVFLQQVKVRSQLKDMKDALEELPAIAAYGESQKGKSYLMGNLLQCNGKPFTVNDEQRAYNFVRELNPIGDGKEATGVVTRFSSFDTEPGRYSKRYPVIVKLFSVADLVCVLTDGWHNDVIGWTQSTDKELEEASVKVFEDYNGKSKVQDVVTPDDVMLILHYLDKFVDKAQNITRSLYLKKLAQVIEAVPVSKFDDVFSILWSGNSDMTALFKKLIDVLAQMKFSKRVYLPVDALAHNGIKERTIMSVNCLNGLYDPDFKHETEVYIKTGEDSFQSVGKILRSSLSAVCSEVVVKIGEEFLSADMTFSGENLAHSTHAKLKAMDGVNFDEANNAYKFSRGLLKVSDLLDFPGARSREKLRPEVLLSLDNDKFSYMVKVILRGKVSYLFNRFSDSRRVNLLMFCHDAKNVNVTDMYITIEDWIHTYIGKTPAERTATLAATGGRPPFFIISTMFNLDMVCKEDEVADGENAVSDRWKGRFQILDKDCLQVSAVDWYTNWAKGRDGVEGFRNAYVLRDFRYSACTGEGNNLYEGFNHTEKNPREKKMHMSEVFYNRLRSTFVKNEQVKKFVADPELCWDLSASINNDGSALIIQNLTATASKLSEAREKQFGATVSKVLRDLESMADNLYERIDDDGNYTEALKKISKIMFNLDCAGGIDNYFFGRLIDSMQLSAKEVYTIVHNALANPDIIKVPTQHVQGSIIRDRLGEFKDRAEGLEKLLKIYGFRDEEAAKADLEAKGVNIDHVLGKEDDNPLNRKRLSSLVAEEVVKGWTEKIMSPTISTELFSNAIEPSVLVMLTDKMVEVAKSVKLAKIASGLIAPIVDNPNLTSINELTVSEIMRNCINEFATDWGYSNRSADDLAEVKTIDETEELDIFRHIEEADAQDESLPDLEDLSALFDDLRSDTDQLISSFKENYFRWVACMKIGFLSKNNGKNHKPALGVKANNEIGKIYEDICSAPK